MSITRFAALSLLATLAACATTPPTPPPHVTHAAPHKPPAPLDWFHRQLALAKHARHVHLPASDIAGAQRAYYAVLLPACAHVAKAGPDQYRARCRAIVSRAADASAAANEGPACPDDDHDDSADPTAKITACSD